MKESDAEDYTRLNNWFQNVVWDGNCACWVARQAVALGGWLILYQPKTEPGTLYRGYWHIRIPWSDCRRVHD